MALTTYTVIYRTGGTLNAKWQAVFERYTDIGEARAKQAEIERMGYKALVQDTARLAALGLPEGWGADIAVGA